MAKQKNKETAPELTPEIITKAKAGDSKAINQLLAWTTNFVRSKIHVSPQHTHDRRSDVSQEVAIKVIDNLESFKGTDPVEFEKWVFVIARHTTAQSIRDAGRDKRNINNEWPMEENLSDGIPAMQNSPSRMFADEEMMRIVMRILWNDEKLDADNRKVIILRLLYKFPVAEVARRMNMTEAAVDSRFRRAMEKLRQLYEADAGHKQQTATSVAQDKRAAVFLEYVRRCDAGKTVDINAFLGEFELADDEELRTLLEMIETIREFNLKDDEEK